MGRGRFATPVGSTTPNWSERNKWTLRVCDQGPPPWKGISLGHWGKYSTHASLHRRKTTTTPPKGFRPVDKIDTWPPSSAYQLPADLRFIVTTNRRLYFDMPFGDKAFRIIYPRLLGPGFFIQRAPPFSQHLQHFPYTGTLYTYLPHLPGFGAYGQEERIVHWPSTPRNLGNRQRIFYFLVLFPSQHDSGVPSCRSAEHAGTNFMGWRFIAAVLFRLGERLHCLYLNIRPS